MLSLLLQLALARRYSLRVDKAEKPDGTLGSLRHVAKKMNPPGAGTVHMAPMGMPTAHTAVRHKLQQHHHRQEPEAPAEAETADSEEHVRTEPTPTGESEGPPEYVSECPCVGNGQPVVNGKVKTTDGVDYPADYGTKCREWENEVDPACTGPYKPAYCDQRWCYVAPDCAVADAKTTMVFGKNATLRYSYQNCGSFDGWTAMKCLEEKNQTACEDPCAWNEKAGALIYTQKKGEEEVTQQKEGACQSQMCQCTGSNEGISEETLKKLGKDYGKECLAWDHAQCEQWEGQAELGIWCCKTWCYVDQSCPSAKPSSAGLGLYYSYFACPDDLKRLETCEYTAPVDFEGEPVPLTEEGLEAVKKNPNATTEGYSGTPATATAPEVALLSTAVVMLATARL